ncbi:hypothetical protein TNCV_1383791 [Trichonephila clavipes]|nr:hypothetical protein TNCV_1383791 [Trichonephila clavipes]
MLGRRTIAARPRPPATVRDLEIALLEEWNSIPQSLIDNLIASMANRGRAPQFEKRWGRHIIDFRTPQSTTVSFRLFPIGYESFMQIYL